MACLRKLYDQNYADGVNYAFLYLLFVYVYNIINTFKTRITVKHMTIRFFFGTKLKSNNTR